jgi:hypothetical protein
MIDMAFTIQKPSLMNHNPRFIKKSEARRITINIFAQGK